MSIGFRSFRIWKIFDHLCRRLSFLDPLLYPATAGLLMRGCGSKVFGHCRHFHQHPTSKIIFSATTGSINLFFFFLKYRSILCILSLCIMNSLNSSEHRKDKVVNRPLGDVFSSIILNMPAMVYAHHWPSVHLHWQLIPWLAPGHLFHRIRKVGEGLIQR